MEGVGWNSLAFGLNENDFAFGFSFDVSGFGGTPLPGFELTAHHVHHSHKITHAEL